MASPAIQMYQKYVRQRGDILGLFELLNKHYQINRVLYPGSHIHITPSFVFPDVTYVDNFKKAETFFTDDKGVNLLVEHHKQYKKKPSINFRFADYTKHFGEKPETYDLLISLYAGFISQACKKYLKQGGILAANNSHADAGMASIDENYEFIAAINHSNNKYRLTDSNLDDYFIPKKKNLKVTKKHLKETGRGVGYTKTASVYVFRKK